MLAKHKVRRGLRPSSPLHFSRQSSVVSTSANLEKQISKAASVYGIVLPFSAVECEKFYVIAADYLTPKIFDYKGLLSGRDSTLIPRMRSDHHLSRMNPKLCEGDSPGHHLSMPARVGCWTKASWIRDWGKRDPANAAKDRMSVKEFLQVENQSEEKLEKIREPAQKFAPALLKSV